MSKATRIGVIGCGSVSDKYVPHVRQLNLQGLEAEVVIGCDANPGVEDKVRNRFKVKEFTSDYRDVLKRDDVDIVLVLTSMQEHGRLTAEALQAGKHVLVEKPMSMSLTEAGELLDMAKSSKGHLVCAPHVVLSPTYQNIWRLLHAGRLGRVLNARGFMAGPAPIGDRGSTRRAAARCSTWASTM